MSSHEEKQNSKCYTAVKNHKHVNYKKTGTKYAKRLTTIASV